MSKAANDDPWLLALPEADAEGVVAHVVAIFRELIAENAATYHFDMNEVRLTSRLGIRLQNAAFTGRVGFFHYEPPTNTRDETDPRRLDITFSTVVADRERTLLVFEFKKLPESGKRAGPYRRRYLDDGIRRFVQGSYAPKEAIGYMVAFIENNPAGVMNSLTRSLSAPGADTALGLQKYANGKYFAQPPLRFAQAARFSTRHARDAKLGVTPEITLFHIPLSFA